MRDSRRTAPLTIHVTPELREALAEHAWRDERTLSTAAARILREALMPKPCDVEEPASSVVAVDSPFGI